LCFFFFQAEDGIRDLTVTGVQTCALPILALPGARAPAPVCSRPEAPFAFLDDAVPASSRSWIDAEDFHADTLGTVPDDSFIPRRSEERRVGKEWRSRW